MAVGEIFELVQTFIYLGETMQNVWHFLHKTGARPEGANELASGFNAVWKPLIMGGISDDCEYTELKTINIMNPADFDLFTTSDFGLVPNIPSANAATFLSWAWRFEQLFPGAPTGGKRFPGVAEELTNGNVYFLPGTIEVDLKAALESTLVGGTAVNTYKLVLVNRPFSVSAPPTVWWEVDNVTYTNLSTQNSRKP